jgi:DNA-binding FrmR family transcriptional regulator
MKKTMRSEEDKKILKNRLNRISGQIDGVKKMIDDNRYCDDVLTQLSAIEKAVKSLSSVILERHMYSCITREVKDSNLEVVDEMMTLFRRFQS